MILVKSGCQRNIEKRWVMLITVFTHKEAVPDFEKLVATLASGASPLVCKIYDTYDDFIAGFPQDDASAVIVARHGADGMESARSAKIMQPDVPLIWFSDDQDFGVESYRIGCDYFSADAVTETLLTAALARCRDSS